MIQKREEKEILNYFPPALKALFLKLPEPFFRELTEIRFRVSQPVIVLTGREEYFLSEQGDLVKNQKKSKIFTQKEGEILFRNFANFSVYALEEELKNGFITLPGGHRVGLSGKAVMRQGELIRLTDISGFNIRISREVKGAADRLLEGVLDKDGSIYNTLIVSPPRLGKTTILRDLIRQLSNGDEKRGRRGYKVGLIDERSEIACMEKGIPQLDVGIRTDVLDGSPKAEGILLFLRTMSPEIIAMDELGKKEDIMAVEDSINCGVKIIATIHAKGWEDLQQRLALKMLLQKKMFQRLIILGNSKGIGTVEKIMTLT